MIEKLNRKGTVRLLAAMTKLAESDVRQYGKKAEKVGLQAQRIYESACSYLKNELPAIREVMGECFKEN